LHPAPRPHARKHRAFHRPIVSEQHSHRIPRRRPIRPNRRKPLLPHSDRPSPGSRRPPRPSRGRRILEHRPAWRGPRGRLSPARRAPFEHPSDASGRRRSRP
jgi:hypothetical protein